MYSPKKILPLDPSNYFPICKSSKVQFDQRKLGEILAGEKLGKIGNNITCESNQKLDFYCDKKYDNKEIENLKRAIDNEYRAGFSISGLPVASYSKGEFRYQHVPIGYKAGTNYFIRTKFDFGYSCDSLKKGNTVFVFDSVTSKDTFSLLNEGVQFNFTYTITSIDPTEYINQKYTRVIRDPEFGTSTKNLTIYHCISLVLAAFCIISAVVLYMQNNNKSDDNSTITKGFDFDFDDTAGLDEIGWRLLHGDVFRSPSANILLCAMVGAGVEFAISLLIVFIYTYFGFFEITSLSSFIEPFVVIYFFTAPLNGFLSMKLFKTVGRQFWKRNLLVSGIFSSVFFFVCYVILQISFLKGNSSATVSFSYLIKTSFIIFGGSFFFHVLGSVPALKSAAFSKPTEVNQLPRHIPNQPFTSSVFVAMILGGFIVFILISLNYHMLLESLWTGLSFYDMFGSGSISLILAFTTSIGVSIIAVYTMLSSEDYRWWWRAFITPASCGIFVFIYGVGYAMMSAKHSFGLLIPYIIESLMFAFVIGLSCGSVGFFGAFVFVRLLYDSLKME